MFSKSKSLYRKGFGKYPVKRWSRHKQEAKRGSQTHFHRAIRAYGETAFEVCLLSGFVASKQDLNAQERYFIGKYQSNNPIFGYNITGGGDGHDGFVPSMEHKLSISFKLKGKPKIETHRYNAAEAKKKYWGRIGDVINLRIKGCTFREISKQLGFSYMTASRLWKISGYSDDAKLNELIRQQKNSRIGIAKKQWWGEHRYSSPLKEPKAIVVKAA